MLGCLSRDTARRGGGRGRGWGGASDGRGGVRGRGGASAGARSAEHRPAAGRGGGRPRWRGPGRASAQDGRQGVEGTGGSPLSTPRVVLGLQVEAVAPCTPGVCFAPQAVPPPGQILPHTAHRASPSCGKCRLKKLFWQKKTPHSDTTCSRKSFPPFFFIFFVFLAQLEAIS